MLTTQLSISSGVRSAGPERVMPSPPAVHGGGEPVESRNFLAVLGTVGSPSQPVWMIRSARAADALRQPMLMVHSDAVADVLCWRGPAVGKADALRRPRRNMCPGAAG